VDIHVKKTLTLCGGPSTPLSRCGPVDNPAASTGPCLGGPMTRNAPFDVVLNPAVRVLWRAEDVVQLELGARDAIRHSLASLAEAG
jgi:hypothetical protein